MLFKTVSIRSRSLLLFAGFIVLLSVFAGNSTSLYAAGFSPGLPNDLNGFTIRKQFVPLDARPVGTIKALRGELVIRHGRTFTAYYASLGDRLYEHDVLYTLKGARCRVGLVTADIITLGANTRISMDSIVDDRQNRKKRTRFSLLKGRAMFYVIRLFRYRKVSTEIKTPTAVCGVRGTKFGVKVAPPDKQAVRSHPLYLADAAATLPPGLLAQNNSDGGLQTTVYGFDGEVTVTSTADGTVRTVGAGHSVVMGTAGSGPVVRTPQSEARQFSRETESAPDQGKTGKNRGRSPGKNSAGKKDTGGDEVDSAASNAEANAGDLGQTQTNHTIQSSLTGRVGYFSALLTRHFSGSNLADVYVNGTPQYMGGGQVRGDSIVDSQGFIIAAGTDTPDGDVYAKQIKTIAGGPMDSGDLGTTRRMDSPDHNPGYPEDDNLGENDYMNWGFWRMSTWVQPGGPGTPAYAVVNRAYRIEGQMTPTEVSAGIVGHYGGPAWGTYFDTAFPNGVDMVGTFACDVNVPANAISNFDMGVNGSGGKSASISNGTGHFTPGTSHFSITGGNWNLAGGAVVVSSGVVQPGASAAANGALFGPAGQHIGGSWGMDLGASNNAAVGIFVGDRNGTGTPPPLPPPLPMVPNPP